MIKILFNKWVFLVVMCLINTVQLLAQVNIINTNNPIILAQKIVGSGVSITNATVLCNSNQSGTFTVTSSTLGMDEGIILTTGYASSILPANGVNGIQNNLATFNQGTGGDADLSFLSGTVTNDRCILEFDFKADGDSIFFDYKFGSEEYPVFNCTNYNDVFGFFVTGPGYATPENIALVPGTNIPVAINSINNGVLSLGANISNCNNMGPGSPFTNLYINNTGSTTLTYDGFTNIFTAKASTQICATYHLKLAIADGFDHIFDSGVFIKAGSLNSNTYYFSVITDSSTATIPYVYEGCSSAQLKIHRENFQSQVNMDTATVVITGTATNGVDYPILQTAYYFSNSMNDSIKNIVISPINDLITEGTETLKLILKNKCGTIVDSLTIEIKDPPQFTVFNNDTTICQGESVQVNGVQNPGLNFSWNPISGVSNPTILNPILTPNITTSYIVTSIYGNCVPIKDTVNIIVNSKPNFTITPTNIICNGNSGSILATELLLSNPITYTLIPGSIVMTGSPSTFSNLSAGTYTITASSVSGCTKSGVATITEPIAINWTTNIKQNVTCNSINNGLIISNAIGGTGLLSYNLMPGNVYSTTGNYSSLTAGTYTVTVTDVNGCSKSTSLIINQITGLNINSFTKNNVNCFGLNDGTALFSTGGGLNPYTYTLMPGVISNTTGSFTGLAPNTYTITVLDAVSCASSTVFTITQPTVLSLNAPLIVNPICNGVNTGSVSISATGGTPTILYQLNPGGISNTTGNFTSLYAGTYTVTATDSKYCSKTSQIVITQPPLITITNLITVNPNCNNVAIGGSINFSANGGVAPLTYKLNTGTYQSGTSYSNLSPGIYTITAKDANNCIATSTATISITNAPTLLNNTMPMSCLSNTDTIIVWAINGTPPYTYNLQPNNLSNNIGIFPNTGIGVYTISVIDASGCTASLVLALNPPPGLLWAGFQVTNVPCNGVGTGSLQCSATSGTPIYTYQIAPSNSTNTTGTFSNLPLNTYTVTVTDVLGCTNSSVTTISILPSITFNLPTKTTVKCNGGNDGSISVTTIGGTGSKNYILTPGAVSNTTGNFMNLTANTYTIKVTDASGCSNTTSVIISEPPILAIANITSTPPNCAPTGNGSITVNATGGILPYEYKLNTGFYQSDSTISNLSIGNYTITVKDSNGCTQSSIYNLNNLLAPIITSLNINQANCTGNNNGIITTILTGGVAPINYTINPTAVSNSTGIFTGLPVNTYTVMVTDAAGCTTSFAAIIQEPSSINWNTQTSTPVTCNGLANGQITQTALGGSGIITYTQMPGNISNTNGIFSSLAPNTYTITATDANGCTLTTTAIITQPLPLSFSNFTKSNAYCFNIANGQINTMVNGGTGSITYSTSPGNFSDTTGIFNTLLANTYTITATDANGCSISSTTIITQPSTALILSSLQNTIPSCNPGNNATITTIAIGGTPNYLYSINGGLNQLSNIFTGIGVSTYTIKVTDAVGCSITSTLAVSNAASPIISNASSFNVLCYGNNTGNITTTASGGSGTLSYKLNPGSIINSSGSFNNLFANNYTVIVTDANGCSGTSNIIISQPPLFIWDSVNNRDVPCFGGSGGLVTSSASGGAGGIIYTLLPNNTSNSIGTFLTLGLGQYTLSAVDANGCQLTSNFSINQSPQIIWNTTSLVPPTCYGDSNGTIQVLVTGGVGSFVYKIQPGNITNTTGNFTNLAAGVYTITAKDVNSCTQTTAITINATPQVILTNAVTTYASCNPGCDGSVAVSATGGNGVYTYSINNSTFQSSNQFAAICSGAYTVSIKDGNNCLGSGTFGITTATGPNQITANNTNVSCFGGNSGSTIISATGGTGSMTYKLLPITISNTTGIFSNLTAGIYSIIASDANGCTLSTSIQITEPTAVSITSITPTLVSCISAADGTLTVLSTGGTGAFSYNLQAGNTTNLTGLFSGLIATTYTIKVTDANGCSTTSTQTVGSPIPISFTSNIATPVNCNAGNDGTIQVATTGGTGLITYTIQPQPTNNTTGTFSNLPAGTYVITATDANGCTKTTSSIITQPTALAITQITATNPTCVPGGDATITIAAAGATPLYSYSLNNSTYQLTPTFINLSTGIYTIMVKDANGCTKSATKIVAPSNAPVINSVSTTLASCNPGCDAVVTINSSNGTGLLNYSINLPTYQTNNVFNNVCAGQYQITVKDAVGCTVSSSTVVETVIGPILVNTQKADVGCNGATTGNIHLTILGGTGNTNFVLMPGNITNTNGIFLNLAAGNYTITGTDANGCTIQTLVAIVEPPLLQFNTPSIDSAKCFNVANGSIVAPVSGGTMPINYSILPTGTFVPPNSFTNLLGDITYTISATDANLCSISTTVYVGQPNAITITSLLNTPVTCNGQSNGTISTSSIGGTNPISYQLLPGNIFSTTGNFTNLSGNTYTIIATDANDCSITSNTTLFEPSAISITNSSANNIVCFGQTNGSVSVNATGGIAPLSYNLLPTNITNAIGNFSSLSANIYTVTITDANGCTKTNTQTVIEPMLVDFISVTPTNVLCNGGNSGSITAIASGGVGTITYQLNPIAIINTTGQFNNLFINNYTVTASDDNGCSKSSTVSITQPSELNLFLDSFKNVTCFGGNDGLIGTHASGGTLNYLYNLQPTNINSSLGIYPNLVASNYTMFVVDGNGCIDSIQNINITQPTEILYTSVTHQDIVCYKDSSGSISVVANGGTGIINYSLYPPTNPSNTTGSFINLPAATYTVIATDSKECTKTTSVTINANLLITMNFQINEPVCFGDDNGEILLNITGGVPPILYSINGGVFSNINQFTNLAAGPYLFTIKDSNNCLVDTTIILTEPEKVGAELFVTESKCASLNDGKIIVNGIGGRDNYIYYVRPGLYINQHGVFSDLKVGTYTLTVKDSAGCSFDTLIAILPPINPFSIQFTKQDIGCLGLGNEGWAKAIPIGGKAPYSYIWSTNPAQTNQEATQLEFGKYTLNVVDANGCEINDSIFINPGPCCDNVFIPNAFSPNGDGRNDEFRILTAAGFELIQLEVYDRWGNKIWSTPDARKGWDGKYKGVDMDVSTYYYIFRYNCYATGEKMIKKGDVQLIR